MKGPMLVSLGIEAGIIATSVACGNAAGAAGVGVPPNPIGGTPTEMFVAPDSSINKEVPLQKPFVFESISQKQIESNPGLSALVQNMAQFGGENKLISDGQPVALAAMDIKGNQMLLMSVNNISDGKTIHPGFIIMEQGASAPVAAISGATTSDGLHTGIARLSDVEVSHFRTNGKLSQSYDSLTEDKLALSFDINPDSEAGIKVIGDPSATSDMIDKALATTLKGVTFRSTHGFEVGLTAEEFIAGLTPDSTPTTNTASTGASEGRNFALAMLQSLSARLNPQVVTNVAASTIVAEPSATPTEQPTSQPPTATSTVAPTEEPTIQPTSQPPEPTVEVTQVAQVAEPTPAPTDVPVEPTQEPTVEVVQPPVQKDQFVGEDGRVHPTLALNYGHNPDSPRWGKLPVDNNGVFLTGVFANWEVSGNNTIAFSAVVNKNVITQDGHVLLPLIMDSPNGPVHFFVDIGEFKHIGFYRIPNGAWGNDSFPSTDVSTPEMQKEFQPGSQVAITVAGNSPNIPAGAPDRDIAVSLVQQFSGINEAIMNNGVSEGQILHLPMNIAVAVNHPVTR